MLAEGQPRTWLEQKTGREPPILTWQGGSSGPLSAVGASALDAQRSELTAMQWAAGTHDESRG